MGEAPLENLALELRIRLGWCSRNLLEGLETKRRKTVVLADVILCIASFDNVS